MTQVTIKSQPELAISPEKLCFIVIKAHEFDAKDIVTDPDSGSNPADDAMISVLEDHTDDPVVAELAGFIGALTEDEQVDLVALAWLGRGDGTITDWDKLRDEAARAHNKRTASYLLGMPMLGDYLEEGLSAVRRFVRRVRAWAALISDLASRAHDQGSLGAKRAIEYHSRAVVLVCTFGDRRSGKNDCAYFGPRACRP